MIWGGGLLIGQLAPLSVETQLESPGISGTANGDFFGVFKYKFKLNTAGARTQPGATASGQRAMFDLEPTQAPRDAAIRFLAPRPMAVHCVL